MTHAQNRDLAEVLAQYRRRRKDRLPFPRLSEPTVRKMAMIAAGTIAKRLNRIQTSVF